MYVISFSKPTLCMQVPHHRKQRVNSGTCLPNFCEWVEVHSAAIYLCACREAFRSLQQCARKLEEQREAINCLRRCYGTPCLRSQLACACCRSSLGSDGLHLHGSPRAIVPSQVSLSHLRGQAAKPLMRVCIPESSKSCVNVLLLQLKNASSEGGGKHICKLCHQPPGRKNMIP